MNLPVKATTPASSANLGPGFDVLGLALCLYNTVELTPGDVGMDLAISGEGQGILDRDPENNLACRSIRLFYRHIGSPVPAIKIRMDNRIPLARGLGSSAATIVGALAAVNGLSGAGLSAEELFGLAVEIEGHADNVAAAMFGGLTIAYKQGDAYEVKRCRPAPGVGAVLLVPAAGLSTAKARAVLPPEVSREEAVFNIGRMGLLVESLITGDLAALPQGVEDALHQPWRRSLIPDFDRTSRACMEAGARGVALSGAGPSLIAFYDRLEEERFRAALEGALKSYGLKRAAWFLEIDDTGTTVSG